MSQRTPKNRTGSGRTRKPSHLSLATPPAETGADSLPDNLVRLLLTQAESLVDEDDPIQAELWCSDVLGAVWAATDGDPDAEETFTYAWLAAVEAERAGQEAALCTLTALSGLAGSPSVRADAAAAADRLAEHGVRRPRWAETVESVTVGECWRYGDVFGDQETILCSFGRQDREHAMLVLIDHTLGGLAKDVFFTDAVAGSVSDLRYELAATPVALLEPVEPAAARRWLQQAFTVTDGLVEPRINEDLAPHRAMALARIRQLPASLDETAVPSPRAVPETLVEEFLASPEAAGLPDAELARRWADLLVDRAVERDDAPARVGPGMLDEVLLVDVPDHAVLDAAAKQAMPTVLSAWTRWAGRHQGLSVVAAEWLENALGEILEEFPDAYRDPDAVAHRNSCPDTVDLRTPSIRTVARATPRRVH
jgi:hypothetical protein